MLLECLRDRQADVLRFLTDTAIPPTSNQAERMSARRRPSRRSPAGSAPRKPPATGTPSAATHPPPSSTDTRSSPRSATPSPAPPGYHPSRQTPEPRPKPVTYRYAQVTRGPECSRKNIPTTRVAGMPLLLSCWCSRDSNPACTLCHHIASDQHQYLLATVITVVLCRRSRQRSSGHISRVDHICRATRLQ